MTPRCAQQKDDAARKKSTLGDRGSDDGVEPDEAGVLEPVDWVPEAAAFWVRTPGFPCRDAFSIQRQMWREAEGERSASDMKDQWKNALMESRSMSL